MLNEHLYESLFNNTLLTHANLENMDEIAVTS